MNLDTEIVTIYKVLTANFNHPLFYETQQDALDFYTDQISDGFWALVDPLLCSRCCANLLLSTMDLPDDKPITFSNHIVSLYPN